MNYYEILQVTPESDLSQIKAAYRRLARKYHPDVNPSGAKKFKLISKAYDTLSNEAKRKEYDILNGIFKKSEKPEEPKVEKPKEEKKTSGKKKFSKNIFDGLFEEKIQPKDGDDINADVIVSLTDVLNGTQRTVNVVHKELCPRCKGRRFINGTKCSVCNGSGEYSIHKRITVKIPKGVKDGAKLRLKGEGNEGKFGGKNGDLYLHIHLEASSEVRYEDLNILYTLPITPYEAVLGGEIAVPATNIKLQLPPKTSSGQKFRLSGQGLKKNGKTGDMIVTVSVEIPKTLSDDEVKLYEKLKKLSSKNIRENL